MGGKVKGAEAERELVSMLWGSNWAAVRAAGSGVTKFYCPDVIASNGLKTIAFECKSTKHKYQYFDPRQISDLKEFAKVFKAEPVLAVKFSAEWRFFKIEDLEQTKNNLVATSGSTKSKFFSDVLV